MKIVIMSNVVCPQCNMDCSFPDDSKIIEDCPWCSEPIQTGWGDLEDEEDE